MQIAGTPLVVATMLFGALTSALPRPMPKQSIPKLVS